MKHAAVISLLFLMALPLFADKKPAPELVKVYCFSDSTDAGFSDKWTSFYCDALQKRGKKKKSLSFVDSKEGADVLVEYISSEQQTIKGETTLYSGGIAVAQNDIKKTTELDMTIGTFTKRFSDEYPEVIDEIEEWIRENRETILKKANEK